MEALSVSKRKILVVVIPLLIILVSFGISKSVLFNSENTENASFLALGITADLLLTCPLIYFLLIRKTTIPKASVFYLFVFLVFLATCILPKEHQWFLNLIKHWMLPLVELTLFTLLTIKVRKTIHAFRLSKSKHYDFFDALKMASHELLPARLVPLFATEFAVLYYSFFSWRKPVLDENQFSYHKNSVISTLLGTIIFLIGIETTALHLLLQKWSPILAWVLTVLSVYSAIQVFGIIKSIIHRPVYVGQGKIHLRYGILNEVTIGLEDIEQLELSGKPIEADGHTRKFFPFGELEDHNIIISLKREYTLTGFYGRKRTFKRLLLRLDNETAFKGIVEKQFASPD